MASLFLIPAKAVGLKKKTKTTENRHLCEEQLTKETYVLPKLWVYIQRLSLEERQERHNRLQGLTTPVDARAYHRYHIIFFFLRYRRVQPQSKKTLGNDRGSSSILCVTHKGQIHFLLTPGPSGIVPLFRGIWPVRILLQWMNPPTSQWRFSGLR